MLHRTNSSPEGYVFRWPKLYDLMLRLLWRESEPAYRETVVSLSGMRAGDSVLDVGSGTGTLAIAAARRVGPEGKVVGIDASPAMVACAGEKAERTGMRLQFAEASADDLPFPDHSFDAVVCTTVLHCLPGERMHAALGEMIRVLKPGGSLLLVDFAGPRHARGSLMSRIRVHGRFDLRTIIPLLAATSVGHIRSGPVGFSDLHYLKAERA